MRAVGGFKHTIDNVFVPKRLSRPALVYDQRVLSFASLTLRRSNCVNLRKYLDLVMQQFPEPPAWWDSVTCETAPPAIPAESRNWRSFGFPEFDEVRYSFVAWRAKAQEFWSEDKNAPIEVKIASIKRQNREVVLSFAAVLEKASSLLGETDEFDSDAEMRKVADRFAEIHTALSKFRVYEGRINLMRQYKHQISERRIAAQKLRDKTERALADIDRILSEAPPELDTRPQYTKEDTSDGDEDDNNDPEDEKMIWMEADEQLGDDTTWLSRLFEKRDEVVREPPDASQQHGQASTDMPDNLSGSACDGLQAGSGTQTGQASPVPTI